MIESDSQPTSSGWDGLRPDAAANIQALERPMAPLTALLASFDPITLSELNRVSLLDRVEVKYVLPIDKLDRLLSTLRSTYFALTVAGQQLNHYRTLYFDTADLTLYRRHHMGARNRYKVRARQYVESQYTFLEIKHKTNKLHTVKSRLATHEMITSMNHSSIDFLRDKYPYDALALAPTLWNTYTRITLVSKTQRERVTLDLGLGFAWKEREIKLPAVVIAEVKRNGTFAASDFIALMRQSRVRKTGFSKYCVGISLLYPQVKHNRFRAVHRLLARLSQGDPYGAH